MQKCQAARGFKIVHRGPAFTRGHNFEPEGCLTLLCKPKGTKPGRLLCTLLLRRVSFKFFDTAQLCAQVFPVHKVLAHQKFNDTSRNRWVLFFHPLSKTEFGGQSGGVSQNWPLDLARRTTYKIALGRLVSVVNEVGRYQFFVIFRQTKSCFNSR